MYLRIRDFAYYRLYPSLILKKLKIEFSQKGLETYLCKDLGLWDILPSKIDLWRFDEILILRYLSLFQKLKDETSKKIRETNGSQ